MVRPSNKKKHRKPQAPPVKIRPKVAPPVKPGETVEQGPILLTYCHPGQVDGHFHNSVVAAIQADALTRRLIGGILSLESGPRIATTRNKMCREMLDHNPWAKYLLMVDSDMTFTYTDVLRLYEAAEDHDLGVVGGLAFSVGDDGMKSTMLMLPELDGDEQPEIVSTMPFEKLHGHIPENTLVEVFGTGAAFLLIRRDVLEKIRASGGEEPEAQVHKPWLWFAEVAVGDGEIGEDVAFCMRARSVGFPCLVHTGATIGHRKRHTFTYETWREAQAVYALQEANEAAVG